MKCNNLIDCRLDHASDIMQVTKLYILFYFRQCKLKWVMTPANHASLPQIITKRVP